MKSIKTETSEQIITNQRFTLLELLDRLLDKGVMVKGEILLSVADIDLVYLNLGLLLSSVKTIEQAARKGDNDQAKLTSWQTCAREESLHELPLELEQELELETKDLAPAPLPKENGQRKSSNGETIALPTIIDNELDQFVQSKNNIDPKNVEKGLAKLVLTLVDLIRKLMEKQAIRRIEAEQLNAGEIERVGSTFLLLDLKNGAAQRNLWPKRRRSQLRPGPTRGTYLKSMIERGNIWQNK